MYRLLIVDDEEIITDSLYEVFKTFMPEQLDICKAYSSKEALHWLSRTRIDIVLTDIRMPGMSGLELMEEIRAYWPRCRIVFLTGYSEFSYAYQAIQVPNVRYLLKTEGYAKVTKTVQEVIEEMDRDNQMNALLEQTHEQFDELEFMAQGDYVRHLLQESDVLCKDQEELSKEFCALNIGLEPGNPVMLVLGYLSYPAGTTYTQRSGILSSTRRIWHSYLSEQTRSIGIVDRNENMLWVIQQSHNMEGKFDNRLVPYLEGTLELVQQACLASLNLAIGFTISGACCDWVDVTRQHERLRRLQQMKIGDGISMILKDPCERHGPSPGKESFARSHKAETMAAHLEAGRATEFLKCLDELSDSVQKGSGNAQTMTEAYYAIALLLFTSMNRLEMNDRIDYGKLLRLDCHISMVEGFQYLKQIADAIFAFKRMDERDRASQIIDRICQYINEHLGEDLSLVRLAEINYFNPSYLSRFFKQERGINLSDYIDQCRVRKAKELLGDGELKVREVALFVGYDAAHSFTRFFKKVTGLTPQEYRDTVSSI